MFARIKGMAGFATPPARNEPANTPALDNSTASGSGPASNQISEELASSSKGHQPTATADALEIERAARERARLREIISNLKNIKKIRPLETDVQTQLRICKASKKDCRLKIEKLTGVEEEGSEEGDEPLSPDGEDNNEQPFAGSGVQAAQQTQPRPAKSSSSVGLKKGKGKIKRTGHGWTRKKRYQPHNGPPGLHSDNYTFYRRRYYKILGIMAETNAKYHIRWAGKDSVGGRYVDTWVPKDHANKRAVTDWRRRVAAGDEDVFYETSDSEVEK